MQRLSLVIVGLLMLAVGYLWGAGGRLAQLAVAQDPTSELADEDADKIRNAYRRLNDAMEMLRQQGRYEAVTQGVNSFLVLAGGGNAREDLESSRGVDPETFAGLYAGQALPEIQALLDTDEQGRITYNGEVVRMYSKSRLDQIFANRIKINEIY